MVDHIWVPDIYIYNLKSVSNPVLFTKFGGLFVKKDAAANGGAIKFYYAHELQVKFWCKMRFDRFPFDKQVRKNNYQLSKTVISPRSLVSLHLYYNYRNQTGDLWRYTT